MPTNELNSLREDRKFNHNGKNLLIQTYYNAFYCKCKSFLGTFFSYAGRWHTTINNLAGVCNDY